MIQSASNMVTFVCAIYALLDGSGLPRPSRSQVKISPVSARMIDCGAFWIDDEGTSPAGLTGSGRTGRQAQALLP
jgi:hypothetical protein